MPEEEAGVITICKVAVPARLDLNVPFDVHLKSACPQINNLVELSMHNFIISTGVFVGGQGLQSNT